MWSKRRRRCISRADAFSKDWRWSYQISSQANWDAVALVKSRQNENGHQCLERGSRYELANQSKLVKWGKTPQMLHRCRSLPLPVCQLYSMMLHWFEVVMITGTFQYTVVRYSLCISSSSGPCNHRLSGRRRAVRVSSMTMEIIESDGKKYTCSHRTFCDISIQLKERVHFRFKGRHFICRRVVADSLKSLRLTDQRLVINW